MTPQDILARYEHALSHREWEAIAPLVAADATFWFTDGTFHGHEAIREACEQTWASIPDETYWLEDVVWIACDEAAASCIYRFNWTGTIDGERISGNGRGTTVLQKRDAQWLIVHEHLSRNPAPPK